MAEMRRCIGSTRYGIEPHEAPVEDFPKQPSQKDGLGRMCKTHWNQYTAGLARDRKARQAAEGVAETPAAGSRRKGAERASTQATNKPPAAPDTGEAKPRRKRRTDGEKAVEEASIP